MTAWLRCPWRPRAVRRHSRGDSAAAKDATEVVDIVLVPAAPDAPGAIQLPKGLPQRVLNSMAHLPQPALESLSRELRSPAAARLQEILIDALKALPNEQREFFVLQHDEGWTAAEIASARGLTERYVFQEINGAYVALGIALCTDPQAAALGHEAT